MNREQCGSPLDRVQEILDQYATFGKGLHITEFTPASSGQKITGSHRDGVWDEAAQAEYAVKFYRACFAHPAVQAITWWDLCDQGSWLPVGRPIFVDVAWTYLQADSCEAGPRIQ